LSQALIGFPKTKRYTIGQRLDQITLEVIELVIIASYLPHEQKLPVLRKIGAKTDLLKILIRLCKETKCVENNHYQHLVAQLIEIGKMLGGWMKSIKV